MGSIPINSPLAVISPHLDDAVFSCGDLLCRHPGSAVVTLFAGLPTSCKALQTDWDRKSGFEVAAEAVPGRQEEDRRALSWLSARPCWMEFADSQYGETPDLSVLVERLLEEIREIAPAAVVIPAGLYHSDHKLAHAAALELFRHMEGLTLFMYGDALYRNLPGLMAARLTLLHQTGFTATPIPQTLSAAGAEKAAAVQCYTSQIQALETVWPDWRFQVMQPERYWLLTEKTMAT